jgi:branched-chain amino acid transport system substrate-binding protein
MDHLQFRPSPCVDDPAVVQPTRIAAATALLLLVTGCGTRVAHPDIVADTGVSRVRLDPASIAALRQPVAGTVGPAAGPAVVGAPGRRQAGSSADISVAAPVPARSSAKRVRIGAEEGRPAVPGPATAATARSTGDRVPCPAGASPVAIGQVGTFSGVGGTITSAARAAMSVWVKDVNARGGLACHPVQLFTEDDGGDPGRAAADVDELTARHHVIALVGNIVTFSVGGFLPAITSAKVPAVGGDDIAPEWFESPWMFPTGAGLTDQGRGIVKAGVAAGHRQFGLVYCVEVASCTEVDKDLRNGGTKSAGGKLLYDSPVSITQPDYTAQCLNARNAGVDLLGLALEGASMTRLARSCASVGYRPLLAAAAATFNLSNAEDPDLRSFGMVSESPVAPWTAQDTPAMRAFHAAMARYAPQVPPDGEAVLAWTSGALLEAAVAEIPAPELSGGLSPALIVEGLGRIHDDNLGGLTAHLTFAPGEQHALSSGCIFLERLGPGGWSTPTGSTPVCTKN